MGELPPRTRRIRLADIDFTQAEGTTSAHAENTFFAPIDAKKTRNYLRARGEYARSLKRCSNFSELPPRTRRIRFAFHSCFHFKGTTSAHAENTFSEEHAPEPFGNYLRARGEYCSTATANSGARELPPRTRRIQGHKETQQD